jgi:hypothetical protein
MREKLELSTTIIVFILASGQAIILVILILSGLVQIADFIDWGAHKTDLENIRDSMFFIIQIIVFFIVTVLLGSLMHWFSRSEGLKIVPFDTGKSKYDGKAISDSLVAELYKIYKISNTVNFDEYRSKHITYPRHTSIISNVDSIDNLAMMKSTMCYPRLAGSSGSMESDLDRMPNISVAGTVLHIGEILEVIRKRWPIGNNDNLIYGSIQNYDSLVRLIAHMENNGDFYTWEVSCDLAHESQISVLIRDLTFKIAKDLWPNLVAAKSAKTWEGFKYYIESLENYNNYTRTMDITYLECAQNDCIKASEMEKNFGLLFDLYYYIGIAYSYEREYSKAEEMFRRSLSVKYNNGDSIA